MKAHASTATNSPAAAIASWVLVLSWPTFFINPPEWLCVVLGGIYLCCVVLIVADRWRYWQRRKGGN